MLFAPGVLLPMAEDTQNATTQLSTGASQMLNGLAGEFSAAIGSWRGLIGLTLILGFLLLYSGKWPVKPDAPPKSDNTEILSSLSDIRKDIAALKASVVIQSGELGKQLDELETKTTAIAAPRKVKKPVEKVEP